MYRSFSNRVLGGVCGGLADGLFLNAWLWRALFIILTLLTSGAAALAYLVLWWLLPLASPLYDPPRAWGRGILALILCIALIGGWFARATLTETVGVDIYWPLALLLLAVLYFGQQLTQPKFGNLGLGLLALSVPLAWLAVSIEMLPIGLADSLQRAWPALLVFGGLSVFLRDRLRFSGILSLLVSAALVGGIATIAFTTREGTVRDNNEIMLTERIAPEMNLLQLNLSTLDTSIRVGVTTTGSARLLAADYLGSNNIDLVSSYDEDSSTGIATWTLDETQMADFPMLEDVGRGTLSVALPEGVALAIAFAGEDVGAAGAEFDLAALNLERLNLTLNRGDVLVTLPDYQPLSPSVQTDPGTWTVRNGNLVVVVPEAIGTRFILQQSSNQQPRIGESFNDLIYALEIGLDEWFLVSRRFEELDVQLRYNVNVPNGTVRINTATQDAAED